MTLERPGLGKFSERPFPFGNAIKASGAGGIGMRITKEPSGGRGEYEWCDFHSADPDPTTILNRRMYVRLPGGNVIDTGCVFEAQGGKQRMRLAPDMAGQRELYPHWHVASVLMLPRPSRDETSWRAGSPVLRDGEYGITHLHLGAIDVVEEGRAVVEIVRIEVANQSGQQEIGFAERYEAVRRVWQSASRFEDEIRNLLEEHRRVMESEGPVSPRGLQLVADLQNTVSASATDYDVIPSPQNTDVLPTLLGIIQIASAETQLDPHAIPDEDIVLRRRTIAQQRRWAAVRGASAVGFRRSVQRAYRFACVVCGLRLPPVGGSPGVDAAHILPYAEYDLDDVRNGLCLCKLHHWAFDEGLIEIRHDGADYLVSVPLEAEQRIQGAWEEFSIVWLKLHEGKIPDDRLPTDASERPKPELLQILRELLY